MRNVFGLVTGVSVPVQLLHGAQPHPGEEEGHALRSCTPTLIMQSTLDVVKLKGTRRRAGGTVPDPLRFQSPTIGWSGCVDDIDACLCNYHVIHHLTCQAIQCVSHNVTPILPTDHVTCQHVCRCVTHHNVTACAMDT